MTDYQHQADMEFACNENGVIGNSEKAVGNIEENIRFRLAEYARELKEMTRRREQIIAE